MENIPCLMILLIWIQDQKTGEKVKRTQDLHKEEGSKGGKERKQLLTREVSNSTHLLQKNN